MLKCIIKNGFGQRFKMAVTAVIGSESDPSVTKFRMAMSGSVERPDARIMPGFAISLILGSMSNSVESSPVEGRFSRKESQFLKLTIQNQY